MRKSAHFLLASLLLLTGCNDDASTDPPRDVTPPARVLDLGVESIAPGSATLRWTAPGDDGVTGKVTSLDLRYLPSALSSENWDSALVARPWWTPKPAGETERCTVTELEGGTLYFALRTADEVPNWSDVSNVVVAELPPLPTELSVEDLTVISAEPNSVLLRWTAPGDSTGEVGAVVYDLRYAVEAITPEIWDSAVQATGLPEPSAGGTREAFEVTGLEGLTTYYFALKVKDTLGRWSALSNVVSAATIVLASFNVTDLAAVPGGPCSVELRWTAPVDSAGYTDATAYDLRYALSPITRETWTDAEVVQGMPAPLPGGTPETFTVTGLKPVATYHFAIKAADDQEHWSTLSNPASAAAPLGSYTLDRLTTTDMPRGTSEGDWSPDGQTIVFSVSRGDQTSGSRLYRMSVDGGEPEMMTDEDAARPRWSPDGSRLAFAHNPWNSIPELKVMTAIPGATPVTLAVHEYDETIGRPSWSPDGLYLVYHVQSIGQSPPMFQYDIYKIEAVQNGTRTWLARGSHPAWSPDGTKIAYTRGTELPGIWVMSPNGGDPVRLGEGASGLHGYPCWSPEGARIAFSVDLETWIMSATGANRVRLASAAGFEAITSWSPDGWAACQWRMDPQSGVFDLWILRFERR